MFFVTPAHLNALASAVVEEASNSSFLYSLAWRHKYASLLEGFLTRQSLWDRLVFDAARAKVLGKAAGTVRAAVSAGGTHLTLLEENANTDFIQARLSCRRSSRCASPSPSLS